MHCAASEQYILLCALHNISLHFILLLSFHFIIVSCALHDTTYHYISLYVHHVTPPWSKNLGYYCQNWFETQHVCCIGARGI